MVAELAIYGWDTVTGCRQTCKLIRGPAPAGIRAEQKHYTVLL